jgi:hypothetical protein
MSWVAQHCTIVDPTTYGGNTSSTHLHDCRGAA